MWKVVSFKSIAKLFCELIPNVYMFMILAIFVMCSQYGVKHMAAITVGNRCVLLLIAAFCFILCCRYINEYSHDFALAGPTSVFNMISKEDKNKLKEAQSHSQQQKSSKMAAAAPPPTSGKMIQPPAGPAGVPTASDAKFQWGSGAGFQPFAKDPEKQRRYEAFLARSKGSKAGQLCN